MSYRAIQRLRQEREADQAPPEDIEEDDDDLDDDGTNTVEKKGFSAMMFDDSSSDDDSSTSDGSSSTNSPVGNAPHADLAIVFPSLVTIPVLALLSLFPLPGGSKGFPP